MLQGSLLGQARAAASISAIQAAYPQINDERTLTAASLWLLGAFSQKSVPLTKDAISISSRAVSIGAAMTESSPSLTENMMADLNIDPAEWGRAKAAGLGLPDDPPFLSVNDLDNAIEEEILLWQRRREPGRLPAGLVALYGFLGWRATARLYADGLTLGR